MNALALGFAAGSFAWACSSHLIEHFDEPEGHVAELARVLADDGTVFFLTPNAPADFENPFHIHLFEPPDLRTLLARYFHDVTVQGLDAVPHVKADFTARRVEGREGAPARRPGTCGTRSRGPGTSASTRGRCPSPTR